MQSPVNDKQAKPKPRVLIVDDSRVMRVALRRLLAPEFDLTECENGRHAWELLSTDNAFQLVFTDLAMPEMDGAELISRIRGSKNPLLRELPIIVITGKGDNESTKRDVVALGANDFVNKPFNALHIKARAHSYISHRRVTEKLSQTEERLSSETCIDAATGLGSPRYFERVATELLAQVKRNAGNWIWLGIQVDNYKNIYVAHGKSASSAILHKIGDIVNTTVREGDHAATVGPGRFMLVLRSTDTRGAGVLAERLRSTIRNAVFSVDGQRLTITVSIGVCQPKVENTSRYQDILDQALRVVRHAHESGGDTVYLQPAEAETTAVPVTIAEAMKLAESGNHAPLIEQRAGIIQQLLPLLRVLAVNAGAELRAFVDALRNKP